MLLNFLKMSFILFGVPYIIWLVSMINERLSEACGIFWVVILGAMFGRYDLTIENFLYYYIFIGLIYYFIRFYRYSIIHYKKYNMQKEYIRLLDLQYKEGFTEKQKERLKYLSETVEDK